MAPLLYLDQNNLSGNVKREQSSRAACGSPTGAARVSATASGGSRGSMSSVSAGGWEH